MTERSDDPPPNDAPDAPEGMPVTEQRSGTDERWQKWERWREGELQLPEVPATEFGLGRADRPTQVPWRAREGIAIFFLHLLGAALVALFGAVFVSTRDELTVVTILLTEISLVVTTLLWVRLRYGLGPRALGLHGFTPGNIGLGLGLGVAGLVAAALVAAAQQGVIESITGSPPPEPNQIPLDGEPIGAMLWMVGVSVVLLAPIAEEIFFRGFVYGGLRRWAKPWPAVLISSVAFMAAHVQPIVLLPIFVLGIILAWAVERRRSLVPSIVAHLAFNLFGFIALFLV